MLRYRYRPRHRRLSSAMGPCSGPLGRIKSLQKTVTQVIRNERIEANFGRCDEARGYVERLIQIAIKNGDKDKAAMEMADFWLLEKDLIHKLFKVLVPRYQHYSSSFTKVWSLPTVYPGNGYEQAVLELRGNPWPPVIPHVRNKTNLLSNVLLTEARKEYRQKKYKEQLAVMAESEKAQSEKLQIMQNLDNPELDPGGDNSEHSSVPKDNVENLTEQIDKVDLSQSNEDGVR